MKKIIQTRTNLYIIMEYASGGELFDYIVSKRSLPENESCDLKLYYIIYKKVIYKLIKFP